MAFSVPAPTQRCGYTIRVSATKRGCRYRNGLGRCSSYGNWRCSVCGCVSLVQRRRVGGIGEQRIVLCDCTRMRDLVVLGWQCKWIGRQARIGVRFASGGCPCDVCGRNRQERKSVRGRYGRAARSVGPITGICETVRTGEMIGTDTKDVTGWLEAETEETGASKTAAGLSSATQIARTNQGYLIEGPHSGRPQLMCSQSAFPGLYFETC